jgi:hypothetical protein
MTIQTLRDTLRRLIALPEDRWTEAERLFAADLAERRKRYEALKTAPAWKTLDYRAAASSGYGLSLGAHGWLGPFKITELGHLAEQLAIDATGSYQEGLTHFYEGGDDGEDTARP